MLEWILAASLRNRALIIVASLLIGVLGLRQSLVTSIDVLPDLDRPVVTILTESHGLAPASIEQLVTWPIEQAVSGSRGVLRVRSTSMQSLSIVQVDFDWGTDVLDARQIIWEKIQNAVARMPAGVHPQLAPIASIMGQIQIAGVTSTDGTTDAFEMRQIVDRDILPRLLSLPGVAQVIAVGGEPTELRVQVDADRLRQYDVTLSEVADAVRAANVAGEGATIELGTRGPLVAINGRVETPEDLASAVVRADRVRPVRIADVAEVSFSPRTVKVGAAGIDGRDGILIIVTKQPGIDTVDLTERIDRELAALAQTTPPDVRIDPALFRQADFINRAIDNVLVAVRDGALLVVLVLFVFLLNLRTTAITLLAIPMSIAIASLVFASFGLTINTMTLGGLAVAIGTLVDDAIVDVENVYRRLGENAKLDAPRPLLEVVLDASREIRRPVFYGTIIVSVVYLPLFFLSGIEGRLLAPVGLAFLVSVGASLLVALTLTPVLCSFMLGGRFAERDGYSSPVARWLRGAVARGVRLSVRHTTAIISIVASLTLCAVLLLAARGSTFLPPFEEGSAQINLVLPPDVSIATSDAWGRRLETAVTGVGGVASVARRTGRAENDEHVMPVNVTEAILRFDPESPRSREEILEAVRASLAAALPGMQTSVEQPLAHLLSHLLSGVNAQVAIKISGPELATLRTLADRVEAAVESIEGVRDVIVEPLVLIDQVEVAPRRELLARHGLDVASVAETIELALGGDSISRVQRGRMSWPVVMSLAPEQRADPDRLASIRIRNAHGASVYLGDVAGVRVALTPSEVRRENSERRIVVQHNVAGRALGDVVTEVEAALQPIRDDLGAGYSMHLAGQFEAQQTASRTILWLSLVSLAVIVFVLQRHFESMRLAIIILATRPIALLGAVAAVYITGQDLSVATLVGLIALLGVAVRNAILYVDQVQSLAGDGPRTTEVLVEAARTRVVPVFMTALTSGIGVLPLALSGNEPGREILYPVATVILGGLATNTVLDFLVTPGLLRTRVPAEG